MARHVANAHQELNGTDAKENLKAIATSFNFEIDAPTTPTSGGFSEQ
jgi:hypothetical protein